jgi:hypothetical protein
MAEPLRKEYESDALVDDVEVAGTRARPVEGPGLWVPSLAERRPESRPARRPTELRLISRRAVEVTDNTSAHEMRDTLFLTGVAVAQFVVVALAII